MLGVKGPLPTMPIASFADVGLPDGHGFPRLAYHHPTRSIVAQTRPLDSRLPSSRLSVRRVNEPRYTPIGQFSAEISTSSFVLCRTLPLLYFVTSRWTEKRDGVVGGDWESLQSFALDTRQSAVVASQGQLVVPDGYRSAWLLDLLAMSDDGQIIFGTVGFQRAEGSVLGLITVGTTVAAAAEPVQRFGSPLSIPSPDGRFVAGSYLANPETVETQGPEYDLFIRAQRTGKERILTRFNRGAHVLWSPDSRHVAVTFWASSSDSHVVVYSPDSPGDREIGTHFGVDLAALPEVRGNDHVYFETLFWPRHDAPRVRVWGHGNRDPKGFAKCFEVSLSATSSRSVRCPQRWYGN